MIAHIVLFKPKDDLSAEQRSAIVAALSSAADGIPGISRFRVGRRLKLGLPGYEQAMREDYEYLVLIEVESESALRAYLAHPRHVEFGRHFTQSAAAALAYDYELVDAADAASLIKDR